MIHLLLFLNLIAVDIKGEVQNPGVYHVERANISDIIILAGGLTREGDTTHINLSRAVVDEMVIYIPNRRERNRRSPVCSCLPVQNNCPLRTTTITTSTTTRVLTTQTTTTRNDEKININTANLSELMSLHGIGEAIANRIIVFREATPFVTIEDILKVSGIGEVIFAQIKDFITV